MRLMAGTIRALAARERERLQGPPVIWRRRDYSTIAELYEFHRGNGTLGVFWAMMGVFFDAP
jgi:hypothetical protein